MSLALYATPVTSLSKATVDVGLDESHWSTWFGEEAGTQTIFDSSANTGFDDLYGDGVCRNGTQLLVLDFIGQRGAYGKGPNEFEFSGNGVVVSLGSRVRRQVTLEGYAAASGMEGTPFIESFHGHAVVKDTGAAFLSPYDWSNSIFTVKGHVAPARVARRRARPHEPSRAYQSCKDLASWLNMTDEEVAAIVGVGRTTPYAWKRGAEPRPAAARPLYQLHAVVRALHKRLGQARLEDWLGHGKPYPRKLLEQGNIDRFEELADPIIFPRSEAPMLRLDAAWPPSEPALDRSQTARPTTLKRAGSVRSRRLGR